MTPRHMLLMCQLSTELSGRCHDTFFAPTKSSSSSFPSSSSSLVSPKITSAHVDRRSLRNIHIFCARPSSSLPYTYICR